jgi:hypothetical protein
MLGQRRRHAARDGNDLHPDPPNVRQQRQEFLRLSTVAEHDHHIPIRHHTDVSVQRILSGQHDGRTTGRIQRGRDLPADDATLPHSTFR